MTLRPLTEVDPSLVASFWRGWMPERYSVSGAMLERLVWQHSLLVPELSWAGFEGDALAAAIAVKLSPIGRLYGETASATLHVSFAVGDDLAQVSDPLLSMGGSAVFGQDHGHLFPGVPVDCPRLKTALEQIGFHGLDGHAVDLESDLATFVVPAAAEEALAAQDAMVRPCEPANTTDVERFFWDEYPGRWRYDTLEIKIKKLQELGDVQLLLVAGRVEGFAYTQCFDRSREPVSGCVWSQALGERWCGLGPIGVSKAVRGTGLGGALLCKSLERLAARGGRTCAIDWTTLVDFYGKYGFRVSREYLPMGTG